MINAKEIENALRDISAIRRAIYRAEEGQYGALGRPAAPTLIFIHTGLLILVGLILTGEIFFDEFFTAQFLYSAQNESIRFLGLFDMGLSLILMVGGFYFIAWRTAQREGENFDDYLAVNFSYLRNLSFVSDLIIKFIVLAIALVSLRPFLVAPLLLLFTGDYLFQGRLFVFPARVSLGIGMLCVTLSFAQFVYGSPSLVVPLATFFIVTGASLRQLLKVRPITSNAEKVG